MSLQNCCCENRAATADLKYTMASEAAATRANCDANNQKILDKLCQLEMDGMRQNYENRIGSMQETINGLVLLLTLLMVLLHRMHRQLRFLQTMQLRQLHSSSI